MSVPEVLEISKSKHRYGLLIGMPSRGFVDSRQIPNLFQLAGSIPNGMDWDIKIPRSAEVDKARNIIAEQAIEEEAKYVLFLDDDCFPPPDIVSRLLRQDKDIVSGIVYAKQVPSYPVIYKEKNAEPYYDFPTNDLFKVESGSLSCILIKTEVFKNLEKPYFSFEWVEREENGQERKREGEDKYFFEKAKQAGYDVWCLPSAICAHVDPRTGKSFPSEDPASLKKVHEVMSNEMGYNLSEQPEDDEDGFDGNEPKVEEKQTPKIRVRKRGH